MIADYDEMERSGKFDTNVEFYDNSEQESLLRPLTVDSSSKDL